MAICVFILGRSGTGKTYSMRNFEPDELAVVNIQGKIFPFRNGLKIETVNTDTPDKVIKAVKDLSARYNVIVIDDFQYLMANEFMRRSAERGYDKFTEIARHAWDVVDLIRTLPNNVIVYIMCHTDTDNEGVERLKTIGKMLDEKIVLEGMSTIVLKTNVSDGQYTFLTQNNGKDTVKSPFGMFTSYAIENDLKYVDDKIRNYYGIGDHKSDEQMSAADEAAAVITGKKERRRRTAETPEANVSTMVPATPAPTAATVKPVEPDTSDKPVSEQPTETEAAISAAVMAPRRRRRAEAAVDIPTPDQTVYKTPEAPVAPVAPVATTPAPEPRRKRRAAQATTKPTTTPTNTTEAPEMPVEILGDDNDDGLPFDV